MHLDSKRLTFVAMVSALLVSPVGAYGYVSLDIQGNVISPGMDRQAVLAKLKNYRVRCFSDEEQMSECTSVFIQDKGPPHDVHGTVFFEGNKATTVTKTWSRGFDNSDPGKFAQTLYTVLSGYVQQGNTSFEISVSEQHQPGVLMQEIFLTSGSRTITIRYLEGIRNPDGTLSPPLVELNERVE